MGQAANGAATQQLQCCQCSDDEDPKAQLHASLDEANGCVKPLGAPELALSEEPPAALFGRSVPNSPESADSRLQPKAPSPATASHGWQWCEHTGAAELAALVPAASSQVLEAKRVGSTINRWSFSEQHGENTPAGLSQEDEASHEQDDGTTWSSMGKMQSSDGDVPISPWSQTAGVGSVEFDEDCEEFNVESDAETARI
eukprot:gnl/TRDRNA2_/TRDRNA2_154392_c1_seq4.p1 gnl/TRDRNA2_/TRDRNA2_154392_c1~~gnl/TRDRNA2_/TRDRNA2_154392_c1_seq4.p1  ORF type:complete len:200 (-),score=40.51 gnl/TRDRNA2_/TRDRNA2_154392_c1_seq4:48-647(-)